MDIQELVVGQDRLIRQWIARFYRRDTKLCIRNFVQEHVAKHSVQIHRCAELRKRIVQAGRGCAAIASFIAAYRVSRVVRNASGGAYHHRGSGGHGQAAIVEPDVQVTADVRCAGGEVDGHSRELLERSDAQLVARGCCNIRDGHGGSCHAGKCGHRDPGRIIVGSRTGWNGRRGPCVDIFACLEVNDPGYIRMCIVSRVVRPDHDSRSPDRGTRVQGSSVARSVKCGLRHGLTRGVAAGRLVYNRGRRAEGSEPVHDVILRRVEGRRHRVHAIRCIHDGRCISDPWIRRKVDRDFIPLCKRSDLSGCKGPAVLLDREQITHRRVDSHVIDDRAHRMSMLIARRKPDGRERSSVLRVTLEPYSSHDEAAVRKVRAVAGESSVNPRPSGPVPVRYDAGLRVGERGVVGDGHVGRRIVRRPALSVDSGADVASRRLALVEHVR